MKTGFSALIDEYRKMLKATELEEGLDLVLYRPLAFGLVKLVQPTAITANQVTFVSLVMGLGSAACFWQGTPTFLVAGAALLFLTNLLDCADGMLARLRGTSSMTGYLFDGLVDYTTNTAVIVGMLHGIQVQAPSQAFLWLVGVPGGLIYAWWCAMVDRFRNEWLEMVYGKRRDPQLELADLQRQAAEFPRGTHRWDRILIGVYAFYVNAWYSAPVSRGEGCEDKAHLQEWKRVHKPIMQAAVFLGPTMQLTLMMIAGVIYRPAWYFWFSLVFVTVYGLSILAWRALAVRNMAAGLARGADH